MDNISASRKATKSNTLHIVVEVLIICLGYFLVYGLVWNILVPDYTIHMKKDDERSWISPEIYHKRVVELLYYYVCLTALIGGYYFLKGCRSFLNNIPPQADKKVRTYQNVVMYRTMGLMCIFAGLFMSLLMLSLMRIENITQQGEITNSFLFGELSDGKYIMIFISLIPCLLCLGPYLVFYKINSVFPLSYCLILLFNIVLIGVILSVIHISPTYVGWIVSGIPFVNVLNGKLKEAMSSINMKE